MGSGALWFSLAWRFEALVTAVASTSKLDFLRSLGATAVIDDTTADFSARTQRYDVTLGIGGYFLLKRLRRALTPQGNGRSSVARQAVDG